MKNKPIIHFDTEQMTIIKYGLTLIPKIQQSIPEIKYSKNAKLNIKLSKSTLKKFESGNIENLTPEQFRMVLLSINGLYLILIKDMFIDKESTSFAENNSENIRLLQAIMDTYNPNSI